MKLSLKVHMHARGRDVINQNKTHIFEEEELCAKDATSNEIYDGVI